mmetsp:Transcript_5232/g.8815  ORF Transcript_5232/g.8815 Transcript_5232/m.8815 type:complete len:86 (-) Transcript_5232:1165-1422(-)
MIDLSHAFMTLFLCVTNKTAERLLSSLSKRRRSERRSSCSACASSAELDSSNAKILGSVSRALAIHNRCFCPPDILLPLSPTIVL